MAEDETGKRSEIRPPPKKKTTRIAKSPVRGRKPQGGGEPRDESGVTPAAPGGQSIVAWAALLLGVVAAGAVGYMWYQGAADSKLNAGQQEARLDLIEQRIDGVERTQASLRTGISAGVDELGDSLDARIDGLGDSLAHSDADIRQQIQGIHNDITNLDHSIRERTQKEIDRLSGRIAALRSQLDSNLDRWVVEETGQLILIAYQRLRFTGEIGLAKQALRLADQRLGQLSGSAVDEVRRLLLSDIAALERIPPVDVPALLNELSVLSAQVDGLPLAGDIVMDADTDREKEDEPQGVDSREGSDETTALNRYLKPVIDAGAGLLTNLGDLIQIEKNGNSFKPVISAQIREMTYERARLILESAQVALVRQNPALYSHRINAARVWVEHNFNVDAALTRDWIRQLDQVGLSYRDSGAPDISATLSAIRALGGSETASGQ